MHEGEQNSQHLHPASTDASDPNTDAGVFYEGKNVLLIHTLLFFSIFCLLSKRYLPFVLALNLTTRQAIPMYFPIIKNWINLEHWLS